MKIDRYYKMHTDILEICREHNIRIMPGKVAATEILNNTSLNGLKDFLLSADDMDRFSSACTDALTNAGYFVKLESRISGRICRVFLTDMLATTIYKLMKDPDDMHCPQMILREFRQKKGSCIFAANSKTVSFDAELLNELEETDYKGSIVYTAKDVEAYLKAIYGDDFKPDDPYIGYTLFEPDCRPDEFIAAAKAQGLFSKERTRRFMDHRNWKKSNNSALIAKNYHEYEVALLGLKPNDL